MKLHEAYDGVIAEQIAEVALLRTNMVQIQKKSGSDFDFMALQKNESDVFFLVEVKATNLSESEIKRRYNTHINKLIEKSKSNKYILFFIDSDKKTGYFNILFNGQQRGLHKLRIDALTNELGNLFGELTGIEFPPYTFHSTKTKTLAIPVDDKFKFFRLYNLTLSPFEKRQDFSLNVRVDYGNNKKVYKFSFNDLFYNPNLKGFLFFVNKNTEYTDVSLPSGRKTITVSVEGPKNVDFKIKLACEYLVQREESRIRRL